MQFCNIGLQGVLAGMWDDCVLAMTAFMVGSMPFELFPHCSSDACVKRMAWPSFLGSGLLCYGWECGANMHASF